MTNKDATARAIAGLKRDLPKEFADLIEKSSADASIVNVIAGLAEDLATLRAHAEKMADAADAVASHCATGGTVTRGVLRRDQLKDTVAAFRTDFPKGDGQ